MQESYPQSPFPTIRPLTRLHVKDSLRINSDRWQLAHDYHRHRQNLIHQALWEPGIVCGLGVKPIDPPAHVDAQFQDRRWIEIQPGIAIDAEGNPIVVGADHVLAEKREEKLIDRQWRVAVPAPLAGTRLVYIVLRYVDPNQLDIEEDTETDRMIERFRFDQRIDELRYGDIELCRIVLAPGETDLKIPEDPFDPQPNELDFRYRWIAQQRSQYSVHVGTLTPLIEQKCQQWKTLANSVKNLHNSFQCCFTEKPVDAEDPESLCAYNVLYVSAQTLLAWTDQTEKTRETQSAIRAALKRYRQKGGLLYIEVSGLAQPLHTLLQPWGLENSSLEQLPRTHAIRRYPFRFGQLPLTEQGALTLQIAEGVLVVSSALATAWDSENLPRHEIRSVQELGVNILHFAWQKRQYHELVS